MTARNNNSNCENRPCSIFPVTLNDSFNDNQMNFRSVMHWINSFEFTRPKRNIARDFSDASKKASIIHTFMIIIYR